MNAYIVSIYINVELLFIIDIKNTLLPKNDRTSRLEIMTFH